VQPQILVVSDPPHRRVDLRTVGRILGVSVADARLKMSFPAPEVLAAADPSGALDVARSLESAGVSVAVFDARALARLPWPENATSIDFEDSGLAARTAQGDVLVPYDTPVVAVYSKPPEGFRHRGAEAPRPQADEAEAPYGSHDAYLGGPTGPEMSESVEWMTHLDLYFPDGDGLRRLAIAEDLSDLSSLGSTAGSSNADLMSAAVDECARRFSDLLLDKRLENVRPRQRLIMGEAGFDIDLRKLFSFGTLLLRQVLDSISPDLRDITQYEFGSRLAYVLSRESSQP